MRNFKRLLALSCATTVAVSSVAFAAAGQESGSAPFKGDSVVENDTSNAPNYINCILPSVPANTYNFTIDTEGLLEQFSETGKYDGSTVYFNAVKTAATLKATDSKSLFVEAMVADDATLTQLKTELVGKSKASISTFSTDYKVWIPDPDADPETGKGTWSDPLTMSDIEKYVSIAVTSDTDDTITGVTLLKDNTYGEDIWDGTIYYKGKEPLTDYEKAAEDFYDTSSKTVKTGLFVGTTVSDATTAADTTNTTYTAEVRHNTNTSDIATFTNKSTVPVVVETEVTLTAAGLVNAPDTTFTSETDASIYMAIKSGTKTVALDSTGKATAYYVLGGSTTTPIKYQATGDNINTGSHNYYQYEAHNAADGYLSQGFQITAAANNDAAAKAAWKAYVEKLNATDDTKVTKPSVNVVYKFKKVTADASVANKYTDTDGNAYTAASSGDGWATYEAATPAEAAPSANDVTYNGSGALTVSYSLGNGDLAADALTDFVIKIGNKNFSVNGAWSSEKSSAFTIDNANSQFTISEEAMTSYLTESSYDIYLVFDNDLDNYLTITLTK